MGTAALSPLSVRCLLGHSSTWGPRPRGQRSTMVSEPLQSCSVGPRRQPPFLTRHQDLVPCRINAEMPSDSW